MNIAAMTPVAAPRRVDSSASPKTAASPWTLFWVASTAVFLVAIDGTVLFAAFGALRAAFPASTAADASWVLNAYTVVYAALLVPAGRLSDALGRKRIFLTGLLLFVVASAACGAATSMTILIAARAVQAAGAALLTPASLSLLLGAFSPTQRAMVVSLWGAVGGLAAALGPSLGSTVIDIFGWRWAFWLNIPLGLLAFAQGLRLLREWRDPQQSAALDMVGVALLITGVASLAYGIVGAEGYAWSSPRVLGPALAGLGVLMAFVVWSRRSVTPVVDLTLFADANYRNVNLASLSFGVAFSMMFFAMFFFLMQVWHYTLPQAGLAVSPGPMLVVPVATLAGRVAGRYGHRPLLVNGSLLYAAGALWLFLRLSTTPDYLGVWLPGLLLTGVAVGLVMPSLSGAAVARLAAGRFGVGSAVNQAIRQIASVLGVAATVALIGHGDLQVEDFKRLYLVLIVLALLTAALSLRVDTRQISRDPR